MISPSRSIFMTDTKEAADLTRFLKFFVLGAADPEMQAIESMLKAYSVSFGYAAIDGSRVRPFQANKATQVIDPKLSKPMKIPKTDVVFVECRVKGITPELIIDHHNPGDPGYGLPPEKAYEASSLGQFLTLLGKSADTLVSVNGDLFPARIVAAADHCLSAAYRGEVPEVSSEDIKVYRLLTRSKFQGKTIDALQEELEAAKLVLQQYVCSVEGLPGEIADLRSYYRRNGVLSEAAEAAAMTGTPILYEMPRGGTTVVGLLGATAEQVSVFMKEWAPSLDLLRIYGDPARGFAGGFLEEEI
jgi:hypothetical protein